MHIYLQTYFVLFKNIHQKTWVGTLILKPDTASDTNFVTLGKLLDITVLQFSYLKNEDNNSIQLSGDKN